MPRIADPESASQVNKALQRLDKVEKRLLQTQDQLLQVQKRVNTSDVLHAPNPTTNNMTFAWTGSTHTLSWNKGDVQDKNANAVTNVSGIVHTTPVVAGSQGGLLASTHYWVGWSTTQRQMMISSDAHIMLNRPDIKVICRVFTGTAGQTGVAGGGGSEAIRDISGLTYKNF